MYMSTRTLEMLKDQGRTWDQEALKRAKDDYNTSRRGILRAKKVLEATGLEPLLDLCPELHIGSASMTMTFDDRRVEGKPHVRQLIHQVASHLEWTILWLATDDYGGGIKERATWRHRTADDYLIMLQIDRPTKVGARLPSGCVIRKEMEAQVYDSIITCALQ